MRRLQLAARLRIAILFSLLSFPRSGDADRCTCSRTLTVVPHTDSVMALEPAQRAIILWNGKEEILYLSTDLGYHVPITFSELIPFPAPPTLKLGSLESFSDLAALLTSKGAPPADWLPSAPHGVLADLQLASSLERINLDKAPCGKILSRYQARGYSWIGIDSVEVKDYVQSFPPVEYRFKSDKVYYPLEISIMDHGETRVDLFVITHDKLSWMSPTDYPVQPMSTILLHSSELRRLSPDWPAFMSDKPVAVQHLRMVGDIRKMVHDFVAR